MNKSDVWKPKTMSMLGIVNAGSLAYKYLMSYNPSVLAKPTPIDIMDFATGYLNLDMTKGTMPHPLVEAFITYEKGEFVDIYTDERLTISPGTIITNKDIQDDIHKRYLIGHEAAHWLIFAERADYLIQNKMRFSCCKDFSERSDWRDMNRLSGYYKKEPHAELELYADSIANDIFMPAFTFLHYAMSLLEKHGFDERVIIEGYNNEAANEVIRKLAAKYVVPEYAVVNHLYKFGMYVKQN